MAYTIKNTEGTTLASVPDGTLVSNTLSIKLFGKNYLGFGADMQNNFVGMLENFTSNTAPSNPIKGQLWYKDDDADLKIYNGTAWVFPVKNASTLNVSGNANVGNLNTTGSIQASGNISAANINTTNSITAPTFVSNVADGTAPLTVTSTTRVANLSVATAGNLVNGTSNVTVLLNGNVTTTVTGNATLVITTTGANIAGTANVSGNANVGNLGATTVVATTANLTTINSGLLQNGTSNVTVNSSGNVNISVGGNVLTVTSTGANITGTANISSTLNVTGNANTGNLGTGTVVATTGNITTVNATTANATTINSGLIQNGNSNVTITANSNVSVFVNGNATARAVFTSTGANIAGTANITGAANIGSTLGVTGNANVGNIGTGTVVATANLSAPGILNGNSGVTITANSNVTVAVTAANSYTFATSSFAPSSNATVQLGLTTNRWSNVWGISSSAQYADLAEKYRADADYEPGTVLEIGGEHEITVCNTPRSNRVFGCVSTDPAYLMNDSEKAGIWLPVVLTGRAPIRVAGTVNKGDRLVSAGNGAAMAAGIAGSSYQNEIGRALETKTTEDVGIIEAYISTK